MSGSVIKFAATCLLPVVLAGCSAVGLNPPNADTAGPREAAIVVSIPAGGRVISDINIELCQATPGDKPHTADEALHALKVSAAQKGATGVANVTSSVVTTPTPKCYSMAQAMGIAYVGG